MTGTKFNITEAGWRENRQVMYFSYVIETDEQNFNLEETVTFPKNVPECIEAEKLLRALHIALGISYYKAFIPPVIVHPYTMTEIEASFWNSVWKNGLGEFMYKNNITPDQLATFHQQEGVTIAGQPLKDWKPSATLGIGGGKDSIVASELLKEINIPIRGFVLATGEILGQTKSVADVMDIGLQAVKRVIDRQILDINKLDGALNGHIPISLIFGLIGAVVAVSNNDKYVVVANEASSSLPQVSYEELDINHQWSKSLEFERLFQDYLHTYVSEELDYFSVIRPLSSVAVARLFINYPQYFEVFTSDNSLFKIKQEARAHPRWSRDSSKSLSSFILFAPWLDETTLIRIFGHNFLDDSELKNMFVNLIGHGSETILDCVGTPEELRLSLQIAYEKRTCAETFLMKYAQENNLFADDHKLGSYFALQNDAIPDEIKDSLRKIMEEKL